jgi:hypothetical protein
MKVLALGMVLASAEAHAQVCRGLEIEVLPRSNLQLVAWVEDAAGNYVDTVFITETTGRRGLGNRGGAMDIKSGPRWSFGRRESVFPIWAHRHGVEFPKVVFQDDNELTISKTVSHSSRERFYDRPMLPDEMDGTSSGSAIVHTDKGKLSAFETSRYPPRSDLGAFTTHDHPSVAEYLELNVFDAVSRATPLGDRLATLETALPTDLLPGEYLVRVEVSEERDFNADYPETRFPAPVIPFGDYGLPYRGQPSVLYEVPFAIGNSATTTSTAEYAGYSDPDALDGDVREPDSTITTAAARLGLFDDARVRVTYSPGDTIAPGAASHFQLASVTPTFAVIQMTVAGDDGATGAATRGARARRERRGDRPARAGDRDRRRTPRARDLGARAGHQLHARAARVRRMRQGGAARNVLVRDRDRRGLRLP